nr:hypothetical protein Iba_chr10bCG10260 [Ipomoea batatas]
MGGTNNIRMGIIGLLLHPRISRSRSAGLLSPNLDTHPLNNLSCQRLHARRLGRIQNDPLSSPEEATERLWELLNSMVPSVSSAQNAWVFCTLVTRVSLSSSVSCCGPHGIAYRGCNKYLHSEKDTISSTSSRMPKCSATSKERMYDWKTLCSEKNLKRKNFLGHGEVWSVAVQPEQVSVQWISSFDGEASANNLKQSISTG